MRYLVISRSSCTLHFAHLLSLYLFDFVQPVQTLNRIITMVNCSIDEDIYGYATSRVRNIEDMMTGFKHPIKYTGLPANCFKRMEVGP